MPNTPMQALPYPSLTDPANGPVGFQNLAQAVEKKLVQIYVDAADRAAKATAPTAGMFSFLTSTGVFEFYTGAAWVALRPLTNSTTSVTVAGAGNFVKPVGPPARLHIVELWGPGGAGGGTTNGGSGGQGEGGGGGSGGYVKRIYADSELLASEPYVIGAGGNGVSGAAGQSGSASSTFKGLIAGAGAGGLSMASTPNTNIATSGSGGSASGGHLNCVGSDGHKGRVIAGAACLNNNGGAAPCGGGAAAYPSSGAGNGSPGNSPGGGGSGAFNATTSQAGGAGAVGKLLVTSIY